MLFISSTLIILHVSLYDNLLYDIVFGLNAYSNLTFKTV